MKAGVRERGGSRVRLPQCTPNQSRRPAAPLAVHTTPLPRRSISQRSLAVQSLRACAALLACALAACRAGDSHAEPPLIRDAHAHNDYRHPRPLLDALDHGFRSVEADVFPVQGALLVGHTLLECHPERTIDALYIQPLLQRLQARGRVGSEPLAADGGFFLLVDFKRDGERSLVLLRQALAPLRPYLTRRVGRTTVPGELTVIVSGARPLASLAALDPAEVFLDARLGELELHFHGRPLDSQLAPMVSASWTSRFTWRGEGAPPADELATLRGDIAAARARGMRLRYWALPHHEGIWETLRHEGVQLLQADDLARFARASVKPMHRPASALAP